MAAKKTTSNNSTALDFLDDLAKKEQSLNGNGAGKQQADKLKQLDKGLETKAVNTVYKEVSEETKKDLLVQLMSDFYDLNKLIEATNMHQDIQDQLNQHANELNTFLNKIKKEEEYTQEEVAMVQESLLKYAQSVQQRFTTTGIIENANQFLQNSLSKSGELLSDIEFSEIEITKLRLIEQTAEQIARHAEDLENVLQSKKHVGWKKITRAIRVATNAILEYTRPLIDIIETVIYTGKRAAIKLGLRLETEQDKIEHAERKATKATNKAIKKTSVAQQAKIGREMREKEEQQAAKDKRLEMKPVERKDYQSLKRLLIDFRTFCNKLSETNMHEDLTANIKALEQKTHDLFDKIEQDKPLSNQEVVEFCEDIDTLGNNIKARFSTKGMLENTKNYINNSLDFGEVKTTKSLTIDFEQDIAKLKEFESFSQVLIQDANDVLENIKPRDYSLKEQMFSSAQNVAFAANNYAQPFVELATNFAYLTKRTAINLGLKEETTDDLQEKINRMKERTDKQQLYLNDIIRGGKIDQDQKARAKAQQAATQWKQTVMKEKGKGKGKF